MRFLAFYFLLLPMFFVSFSGCEKKEIGAPEKIHWDRDMCERCKMAVSERKFAAEIIDLKTGKVYKFDDIGCATLWLDEEKIPWKKSAIIWVTDAKTGKWIDARKARYVEGAITPMAYGISAYTEQTLPKGSISIDFEAAAQKIKEIEKLNTERLGSYK